jgi:hypothetical protein
MVPDDLGLLSALDCEERTIWIADAHRAGWQRIGNQIDAAIVFAGADFVKPASLIASVMRHSITRSC